MLKHGSTVAELARIWPEHRQCASQSERIAAQTAYELCSAWWRSVAAQYDYDQDVREPFFELDSMDDQSSAHEPLESVGQSLAALSTSEAAFVVGQTYSALLPEKVRARNGVFYTPMPLVDRLLGNLERGGLDWRNARVLDPACGGGAFVTPIAQRMIDHCQEAHPAVLLRQLGKRLRGYEIDPVAAWISQVSFDILTLPLVASSGKTAPRVVEVRDSLKPPFEEQEYDAVVGNPPYGKTKLSPSERQRWERSLYGHANLYGLFTDLSLRLLKPDGLLGLVLPTGFLAGEYFKRLRVLLRNESQPLAVDFVDGRKDVFDGVLQEALLLVSQKTPTPTPVANVSQLGLSVGARNLEINEIGPIPIGGNESEPWVLPRRQDQALWAKQLITQRSRLSDWGYRVSTGPLVWNRKKNQLRQRRSSNTAPLIWAESVRSDGSFRWPGVKVGHAPYFRVQESDRHLVCKHPCVLVQRTTAKEQERRLLAAPLTEQFLSSCDNGVVVENHLNMIVPTSDQPAVPAQALARFLNSYAADAVFRCLSGTVAVSAYELEAMPLPSPEAVNNVVVTVPEDDTERAFMDLYGMNG